MSKKQRIISAAVFAVLIIFILAGIFFINPVKTETEAINEVMRDAVLHEGAKVNFFGRFSVNPAMISSYFVTAIILVMAALIRIFAIPKFKIIPGKFQII